MCPHRAYILVPLKYLQVKVIIKWMHVHKKTLSLMGYMVAKDFKLSYPDPQKTYVIETDARYYHMVYVIK